MDEETLEKLCAIAKKECKITWSGEGTEETVKDMVVDASEAMIHRLGIKDKGPEIFLQPGASRKLFKKHCLYDWNNMLEDFEKNYLSEILAERHRYEVKNAKKES